MRACAALVCLCAALAGCARVIGLPPVPESVTARDAGLDGVASWAAQARILAEPAGASAPASAVESARAALARIARGEGPEGLRALGDVVVENPADLVLGNTFRMAVYRLHRAFLDAARERGERMPLLPPHLDGEPLRTLERAAAVLPTREIRLQIALAHVDKMVLYPALEIKAPASIDSVHAFTDILATDPHYVPALVGRGLNHLNRPLGLVWPEHPAPPADAASRDFALAVAVGAKVGGASPRLKGLLLLLLGDAYAHEGKAGIARSWWSLAGEATDDLGIREELRRRAGWPETEFPARVEGRLEERMADLDSPVGDLSFLWDDHARGPS